MEPTSVSMPSLTLLIVEDDKDSRDILTAILSRKFSAVRMHSAINGRDGVEQFKKLLPDILVTDVNMPEMSGLELAEIVRQIKPETKIIVITADTGKAALEDSIGEGFQIDHYVLKPVDFQKLFLAVEQCITEVAGG